MEHGKVKVTFANGSKKEFKAPLRLSTLLTEESFTRAVITDKENSNSAVSANGGTVLAARVNNFIFNLNSKIRYSSAQVEPVYESCVVGNEIMRHTLLFLISMASHVEFPGHTFTAEHHLGWGYLLESRDVAVSEEVVERLAKRMEEIAQRNLPIVETEKSHRDAVEYFSTVCVRPYTVQLLERLNEPTVKMVHCDGYFEIHTRVLAHATGVLKDKFHVKRKDDESFVLSFPLDPFQLHYKYDDSEVIKVYKEANTWGKFMGVECVGELNHKIREGNIKNFILKCHALHDRKISLIAKQVSERKSLLVLIAGPSSSGKTTFSKKLGIQLSILGLEPVIFSVDDYYKPREECPKNENGEYDFESLDSLRVELLNQHLVSLLKGEKVETPIFDFRTGKPSATGRLLQLPKRSPVVIMEGIHCLNPKLTPLVPEAQKFKIFVAPLIQLNFTEFNFISSAKTRLLRRIVRDFRTRGHSVQGTLKMWPNVRKGEHKFIFPFINTADSILDTSLDYEFSVIKVYAMPLLSAIPPHDQFYFIARELISFLSVFDTIPHDNIPADSLIREFIGGSFFD